MQEIPYENYLAPNQSNRFGFQPVVVFGEEKAHTLWCEFLVGTPF
jgi:hypothetical protein